MIRALLLIAAMFPTATVSADPDLSGVLSLMGQKSMAQACPIAADKALTNAHVVDNDARYIWESGDHLGLLGAPSTTIRDLFRDLAYVMPYRNTFPRWYPIAQGPPKAGDKVYFVGFDFRRIGDAFAHRVFKAKVLRVRNGHVIFSPAGVPGTSGSCLAIVKDGQVEVVAVNMGSMATEDGQAAGIAIGIWRPLLELGRN